MNEANSDQHNVQMMQLLTSVQQQLVRYVRTLLPCRADADDVLQETNLYIWRHAEEFQPGTNFPAWASKVAYYQALTYRKRQARSRLYFSDALFQQLAVCAPESLRDENQDVQSFESCMERLNDQDRRLIQLRYMPGTTVPDVARQVGRSTKAVYNALGRIRTWLLECIDRANSEQRR